MATQLLAASPAQKTPTTAPFPKPTLNQTIYWDDLASTYEYRPYLILIKALDGSSLTCNFVSLSDGTTGAQVTIDLTQANHAWGDPAMEKQSPSTIANAPGKCAMLFLVESWALSKLPANANVAQAGGTGKWPAAGSSTLDMVLKLYAKQLQDLMKNDDRLTPEQKQSFDKWVGGHGAMGVVHFQDPAQL